MTPLVGVFVGGSGNRMGGVAKGLLPAPASTLTLVERLCREARAALPDAEVVLVGDGEAYGALGLPTVPDLPAGVGPLGGLGGLLRYAAGQGASHVLALACDLPRLERGLIARLSSEAPGAAVVLVAQDGVRNPLIARYEVASATEAVGRVHEGGKRSLQAVLDAVVGSLVELPLSPRELATVGDWDTPEDVTRY